MEGQTLTGQHELGLVLPRPRLVDGVLVERLRRLPAAAIAHYGRALRHDQVGDEELPRDL